MITEAVLAEGFKLALNELSAYLKKKSSFYAKQGEINVDKVYLKASKVEEVKTIWQVDRNVNLNEFYHSSKLLVDSSYYGQEYQYLY